MGSSQSTHASAKKAPKGIKLIGRSVSGRKTKKTIVEEAVDEAPVHVSKRDFIGGETNVEHADDVDSESTEDTDNESSFSDDEEGELDGIVGCRV